MGIQKQRDGGGRERCERKDEGGSEIRRLGGRWRDGEVEDKREGERDRETGRWR